MRKRRCKGCGELFRIEGVKINLNWFHDFSCATQYGTAAARKQRERAAKKKAKEDKQAHSKAKRELRENDKGFQTDKAQTIFNRFIRLRDDGQPCISCQKPPRKKNAGHYLSRGAHPELRFEPLNCHLQCEHCNSFKSGNQVQYRAHLIEKIGVENVEWLEGPHKPKRYTIDDLKAIQKLYQCKINQLEREKDNV